MAAPVATFVTPVYPSAHLTPAGAVRIRLQVWGRCRSGNPASPLQPFVLAPELPYSYLPRRFQDNYGPDLASGAGQLPHDPAWIQGGQRLDTMGFHLNPMRAGRPLSRWFDAPVVVGAHPFGYTDEAVLLGGPFLHAHRWRFVVDYGLVVPGGANPPNVHPAHPIGELVCP